MNVIVNFWYYTELGSVVVASNGKVLWRCASLESSTACYVVERKSINSNQTGYSATEVHCKCMWLKYEFDLFMDIP